MFNSSPRLRKTIICHRSKICLLQTKALHGHGNTEATTKKEGKTKLIKVW